MKTSSRMSEPVTDRRSESSLRLSENSVKLISEESSRLALEAGGLSK